MPNSVKYSTTTPANSLRKGNVAVGVNDVNYGPTTSTGWYNGVDPTPGNYVIYKTAALGDPDVFAPQTDQELYNFVIMQGGSTNDVTSVGAALSWIATQSDLFAVNNTLPNIVTDGLLLYLDAGFTPSYPGDGTTWYDLSGQGAHGTLINSPTWNSQGYFTFDGIDDGIDGIDLPQNYVDLMVGMYAETGGVDGLQMVFAKYNDYDKSFRILNGFLRHTSATDFNDWNNADKSEDFVNGQFITSDINLLNNWNIIRMSRENNNTFLPPFVYSLSSDFYNRRYKGKIAFVMVYNRVLTSNEVLQNYNAQKSRFGL